MIRMPRSRRSLSNKSPFGSLPIYQANLLSDYPPIGTLISHGTIAPIATMTMNSSRPRHELQPLPDTPKKMAKNFCANMHATALRSMGYILSDPQEGAERASRNLKLNEIKLLGTVAEDPMVCYTATIQKFKVGDRAATTQVTIIATTFLKGKVVQLYLFAPFAGGKTIAQLLAKQRTNLSQLQRVNRN